MYWILVDMKSYLILIILGFTQLVICLDLSNITYDDSYPVCPVNLFRKKRALTEYTRWIANQNTSPEFIVKVLDEDMTSSNTPVVAVNIQNAPKGGEKIIVGGVIVPPVTTSKPIIEVSQDYTRFVPPTTIPVTQLEEGAYLGPLPLSGPINNLLPIKPKGRNALRDESPPASPQFLMRTPAPYARQYAPITPVQFGRSGTFSPLKPVTSIGNIQDSMGAISTYPMRTTSLLDIIRPTRTRLPNPNDYKDDHDFLKELNSDAEVTRTTLLHIGPARTTAALSSFYEEDEIGIPTAIRNYVNNRRANKDIQPKHENMLEKTDKEPDYIYNMMFYNYEDVESTSKKNNEQLDHYDEKSKVLENTDTKLHTKVVVPNTVLFDDGEADTETIRTTTGSDSEAETETDKDDETKVTHQRLLPTITEGSTHKTKDKGRSKRKQSCSLIRLRQLNFNSPRTLPEINAQLKAWAENSPLAKWVDITDGNLTIMENPIHMMIVDDPSSGQIVSAKQTVMIVAGIQGRDHHAVAAAMYVLYQLIERSDAHTDLLIKYRFWIIPVFNPDGYDYAMTFPHRREWSKNLRQNWDICDGRESCSACELYGVRCTVQPCYGVNLDRNFEYQWIPTEELRAEHPCGSLHAGERQLSEAETWALTNYLHEQRTTLATFVAFKEGEVLGVMYPYSHTKKLRAFDHVYRQRASRASSAAYSISGRPYVAGQTSEFLPLYAGGIEDWVDGHLGIDNTYTIMMFRPTDSYNAKLITERVVHEAYAAMDTLLLQSVQPLSPPPVSLKRTSGAAVSQRSHHLYVYLISFITAHFSQFTNHNYK